MTKQHYVYLNFPVSILARGLNINQICKDALSFALYDTASRFEGNKEERMNKSATSLRVTYGNIINSYRMGAQIASMINPKEPRISINTNVLFDFYTNPKSEFEIVVFLAYCALRSIIGKKPYTRTTNAFLVSRMAGNAKLSAEIPDYLVKYNNRYQLNKIKQALMDNYRLKMYSTKQTRGFYVSFGAKTLTELVIKAETSSVRFKQVQRKKEIQEALNSVRQNIC